MKKRYTVKRIWVILLAVAAILAAVGSTLAIYTSQVYQRAVARNRDTEAIRFSSDKLYRVVSTDTPAKKYYCPMNPEQRTMSFTVCNYDQSKKAVVNQQLLEYDIEIQVANGTEDFPYTINNSPTVNGTWKHSSALAGGKRSTDTYSITFSEEDYNKVEVTVTVTPKDPSLTKNTRLYGILIPIEYATTQGVQLSSEFTDSVTTKEIKDVDAYNFSVSISGGEDDVVIAWDHSQLDIDPFFLDKIKLPDGSNYAEDGNKSTLTIHMSSDNETASYLFQFYNHGPQKPTSWNSLSVSATLKSAG